MKLYIRGEGQLAQAISTCTARHFELATNPIDLVDVFWICHDTPVNLLDESNVAAILDDVRPCLAQIAAGTTILISSQLPVGTTAQLEREFPQHIFACSPENIRVAHGVEDFENQSRVVVGFREQHRERLTELMEQLFMPFTHRLMFVDTETAEMVKHALNAFMGMSIAFINEIDTICQNVGANTKEVSRCVRADPRVGELARLNPGGPYTGGTLARDVFTLTKLGGALTPLIGSIKRSNDRTER